MSEGYYLSADQAAVILNMAGISRDTDVGISGADFDYNGNHYQILQLGISYPGPTSTSPDGTHIVYAPTGSEYIETQNAYEIIGGQNNDEFPFADLVKYLAIGAIAIAGIMVFNLTQKR